MGVVNRMMIVSMATEVCEKMMKKKKKKKRKKKRDFPRQQKDGNDYVIINNTFLQKFDNKTRPPTSLTSSIMQFQFIPMTSIVNLKFTPFFFLLSLFPFFFILTKNKKNNR